MYQSFDNGVAEKLKGKIVKEVTSNGYNLTVKFEDNSELIIEERYTLGADGGKYWSTKFTLVSQPSKMCSDVPIFPQTLLQT